MTWPLVSIIITTYNYAKFLRSALHSSLDQTYPNLEIVVMDNASTDDTELLMQPYLVNPHIRYYRHSKNIGAVANHNSALAFAKGQYLVFLSADDFLLRDFLRKSYLFLQQDQECDVVFSAASFMDSQGQIQHNMLLTGEPISPYRGHRNDFANLLAFSNYISFPSVLAPSSLYQQFGGFKEDIIAIDFELVVRWAKAGIRFGFLPETLHAVRIHDRQETRPDKFVINGVDIDNFIQLIHTHLTPDHEVLLQGYEQNVIRTLQAKVQHADKLGAIISPDLQQKITATAHMLGTVAQRNFFRTINPKIGIILFANNSLPDLQSALQMLLEQTYVHWEAIVIQQPGMRFASLCDSLDPKQKRIHTAQLTQVATPGKAVNHAMILSSSNCLSFLHAGLTKYPPDHLAAIADALSDPHCSITISGPEHHEGTDILTVPLYHFDRISLKRHTIDSYYYFNEQYPIWTEWDMLMRLYQHFPLNRLDSAITQRPTSPELHCLPFDRCALAQTIYDSHPSSDPAIQTKRQLYLEHTRGQQ